MGNPIILLSLEGVLQSWGDRSRFWNRETGEFPTKSAVIGMLFCAMGLSGARKSELAEFADMKMISYKIGEENKLDTPNLSDFHMVGNGYDESDPWQIECIPKTSDGKSPRNVMGTKRTRREYLQDCNFSVLMEIPSKWKEKIESSLKTPVWDIYLGRKCCVPSRPIFDGFYESMEVGVKALKQKLEERSQDGHILKLLSMQRDALDGDEETFILQDVPIAFGSCKQYRVRRVKVLKC